MAESYSMHGEWAKAIEHYKLNLIYDPKSHRTHFRLASEYLRASLLSQALQHCEEAIRLQPNFTEAQVLQASLFSVLGMHEKARSSYRALLQHNPENHEAEILLGATYLDENKLDMAIAYFEKLAKTSKKSHIVWYYLGKTYLMKPSPASMEKAEIALRRSLAIESNFMQAVVELGSILEKKIKIKAIALYESFQSSTGPTFLAENLVQAYSGKLR